jgi:excisionase family DNA binding protein
MRSLVRGSIGKVVRGWVSRMAIKIQGEEYYTSEEACAVLGVKLATLYSYVHRGLLTSYRQNIRRHRLYRRSQVDSLLEVWPAAPDEGGTDIPLAESWAAER